MSAAWAFSHSTKGDLHLRRRRHLLRRVRTLKKGVLGEVCPELNHLADHLFVVIVGLARPPGVAFPVGFFFSWFGSSEYGLLLHRGRQRIHGVLHRTREKLQLGPHRSLLWKEMETIRIRRSPHSLLLLFSPAVASLNSSWCLFARSESLLSLLMPKLG